MKVLIQLPNINKLSSTGIDKAQNNNNNRIIDHRTVIFCHAVKNNPRNNIKWTVQCACHLIINIIIFHKNY